MMVNEELQKIKQGFGIIGSDPTLDHALNVAVQVAKTDLSVLITGESGVGKEKIPQIIHKNSARKNAQYIAVNCGAIPEGTIDSELFGHEKGAFTGAVSDRKGYFEVADKGTIFLDEVGELPLTTQVRLLRVLETGEFIKVGSSKVLKSDVRVVAATNLDMQKAIAEGKFREDLYYRLNTVPISIPPLRNRGEDIYLLFRKFARDFSEKYNMPPVTLSDEACQLLLRYPWPGNVRQLKNITEQLSILEDKREITKDVLLNYLPQQSMSQLPVLSSQSSSQDKSFNSEREILYQVLFDMKKDMNDLKKLVNDLMKSGNVDLSSISVADLNSIQTVYSDAFNPMSTPSSDVTPVSTISPGSKLKEQGEVQDTDEIVEEPLSLEEAEKEYIRKALLKHGNKRKYAAQDLNISERTLYRKIKEYGLD